MLKKFTNKKGFTLMEMMIVVAIIAILMAIIIPTFTNAMNKAKAATDEANLRAYYAEQMATAVLESTDPKTVSGDKAKITVAGVDYTLYGDVTMSVQGEHQLKIDYTGPDGSKVTIPGGGDTGSKPAGSN